MTATTRTPTRPIPRDVARLVALLPVHQFVTAAEAAALARAAGWDLAPEAAEGRLRDAKRRGLTISRRGHNGPPAWSATRTAAATVTPSPGQRAPS